MIDLHEVLALVEEAIDTDGSFEDLRDRLEAMEQGPLPEWALVARGWTTPGDDGVGPGPYRYSLIREDATMVIETGSDVESRRLASLLTSATRGSTVGA